MIQAGCTYVTLIVAGRLLGAARFGGLAALYVAVTTVATGLFLPVEQEIARRRGHARVGGDGEVDLIRRTTMLALSAAGVVIGSAVLAHRFTLHLLNGEADLLVALCIALPGYACCFVSRGVFSGTGEFTRYGVQLTVEGAFRLGRRRCSRAGPRSLGRSRSGICSLRHRGLRSRRPSSAGLAAVSTAPRPATRWCVPSDCY